MANPEYIEKRYGSLVIRMTDGWEHLPYPTSPEEELAKVAFIKLCRVIADEIEDEGDSSHLVVIGNQVGGR